MTATTTLRSARGAARGDRAVALWLLVCAGMIFAMAVIGAITRLSESGLSIMEWAPLSGAIPPLSAAEWERLFALYRQTPEYQEINRGMSLGEFRTIFWWEYVHRLWGRLIALAFLLPALWFLVRGRLRRGLLPHLAAMFGLGALQGLLGWYMVASGFAERTDVSQYRLVVHLAVAVVIYGYVLWVAFALLDPAPAPSADTRAAGLRRLLVGFACLLGVTMVSGGFVAGLNAGLIYNTFPLMDGRLVPADYGALAPWWRNPVEHVAAAQFNHRALALLSAGASLGLWAWAHRLDLGPAARGGFALIAAAAMLQVGLGIATLLLAVPVWLGALHQAGALILLGVSLWTLHELRPARPARAVYRTSPAAYDGAPHAR